MRFVKRGVTLGSILVFALAGAGGVRAQGAIDRIREADLKADLFTLAGDAMRGREGGTLDELTASIWIAERARQAGLQPGGDNGTFFQFFPLERFRVSPSSSVTLGGNLLRMGRDIVPDAIVRASVEAPVVLAQPDALTGVTLTGKVLVVRYAPAPAASSATTQPAGANRAPLLRTWLRGIQQSVASQTPAAIVAIVPEAHLDQWNRVAVSFLRGAYALDPDGAAEQRVQATGLPLLYVRESALGAPPAAGARLAAAIFTDSFQYPTVNIIAKVPGHADYHTPFDNPDRIDLAKLTRMTRWMYATGRAVAEADNAPAVDPNFKLERCRDITGDHCGG